MLKNTSSIEIAGQNTNPTTRKTRPASESLFFLSLVGICTASTFLIFGWDFFIQLTPTTEIQTASKLPLIFASILTGNVFLAGALWHFAKLKQRFETALQWPMFFGAAFLCGGFVTAVGKTFSLPNTLTQTELTTSPTPNDALPVYFWDYKTALNPEWLDTVDIVLPYEKGLPERLLPKIQFKNLRTQEIDLELHGKRPRTYIAALEAIFQSQYSPTIRHPEVWSVVYALKKEAGISSEDSELTLTTFTNDKGLTRLVGSPWQTAERTKKFFLWGEDGGVFQGLCSRECLLHELIERVQFSEDAENSVMARKEWTMQQLKNVLAATPVVENGKSESTFNRERHEKTMLLYLISMLSIDPRDAEAFFHIGKLSTNRQTVQAAIRYGRDLGLSPAKIQELEVRLQGF